jgi:hypothetical protein
VDLIQCQSSKRVMPSEEGNRADSHGGSGIDGIVKIYDGTC